MDYCQSDDEGNNIHTDLLKLLNRYSGLNFVPTFFSAWSDGFEEATKGEVVHGIANLSWTKKRQKDNFYYTKNYSFTPSYLIAKDGSKIKSLEDLKNKRVYIKTDSVTKYIVQDIPNIKIIYKKSDEKMYQAIYEKGDADAFLTSLIDYDKLSKYHLKVVKTIYDEYSKVSIGISHKHKELASIISKIYDTIPQKELIELRNRQYVSTKGAKLKLTKEEKKWLSKKISIKYVFDPDWA